MREWEEEQVRIDRDWYSGAEDGVFAGDEEHNPLNQYEDLAITRQAEMVAKQTVTIPISPGLRVPYTLLARKKSQQSKRNT
jgi:hypothetical protein